MNGSVVNALNLLNLFSEDNQEISLSEMAGKVTLSKPTLFRLLTSLEYCGFLEKITYSKQDVRYKLGIKLLELGNIVSNQLEIRKVALPFMQQLRDEINEVVLLLTVDRDRAVYIEKVESNQSLRLHASVGKTSPFYSGSGPKLLLTFMDEPERNNIISNMKFDEEGNHKIKNKEDLEKEVKKIESQGYALSIEEQDENTIGIAFPIKNSQGIVISALAITIPTIRFDESRKSSLLGKIKEIADNISMQLGYRKEIE